MVKILVEDEIKRRTLEWCRKLGIDVPPDVEIGGRSYYWKGTCVINPNSPNLDHDIVHELVHFRDDGRFGLEWIDDILSLLKIAAVIGIVLLFLYDVGIGTALAMIYTIMRGGRDLVVEGRAEYTACKLAGDPGRKLSFKFLLGFSLMMIASSILLTFYSFRAENAGVLIVSSAAPSLFIISLLFERFLS